MRIVSALHERHWTRLEESEGHHGIANATRRRPHRIVVRRRRTVRTNLVAELVESVEASDLLDQVYFSPDVRAPTRHGRLDNNVGHLADRETGGGQKPRTLVGRD